MELSDSFEVDHPIDKVWEVLTDVERIAPCLPGAQLTGTEGDEFHGLVKVKVGPVSSQYKGKAVFAERDDAGYRAVISASGRDTRGAGNASAKISVHLEPGDGAATKVSVHTDLRVTGKVAQFGRGVLADVSRKLMRQFADNLASLVASSDESDVDAGNEPDADSASHEAATAPADGDGGGDSDGGSAATTAAAQAADDVEAVDLLAVAGASVMKRLVPVLVVLVVVVILIVVATA